MLSIIVLALASLTASNALVIPRTSDVPSTYAEGYLESYDVYHARYLALNCEAKHSTPFFDACCHPMLATENLKDNRAPECSPATITSSPPASTPTKAPSPPKNPSPSPSTGGILGDLITGGIATFFFQNGVAGACGTVHKDSDFVVALPTKAYENGKNCGRKIEIIDPASGNKQTATVADECPTCVNDSCLDLSHALFNAFAGDGKGEFNG
ncbi:barwin-like endoglucanase [Hysterangium stoloniferum]|nr:barwin-like endoglucanase [Hysterangium stoloniferum]